MSTRWLWILALASFASAQPLPERIGTIEFFGYSGMNVEEVRAALPLHEGDPFPSDDSAAAHKLLQEVLAAASKASRQSATSLNLACCDAGGQWIMYVGLRGVFVKPPELHRAPTTRLELPAEALKLYNAVLDAAPAAALRKATDDTAQGYRLSSDPALRRAQVALHGYASTHESQLCDVVRDSKEPEYRAAAALALGYGRRSNAQLEALAYAARDPNELVRSNALQSLVPLAEADRGIARRLPIGTFLELLNSGVWTDRVQTAALLQALTRNRDRQLLEALRAEAITSLIEMAQWRHAKHAHDARVILGRMDDVPDEQLEAYAARGPEAFGR